VLPAWELTIRGLLQALPFLSWSGAEIAETRRELEAWSPEATRPESTPPLSLHNELQSHARAWLLGLLAARAADIPAVADALELLNELPVDAEHRIVVEHLERSLSANYVGCGGMRRAHCGNSREHRKGSGFSTPLRRHCTPGRSSAGAGVNCCGTWVAPVKQSGGGNAWRSDRRGSSFSWEQGWVTEMEKGEGRKEKGEIRV
jgi:hypothetical protein